ncbi:MAG TPA: hypothetical protein VIL18_10270 [Longimicrobiales bacterium]
MMRCWSGALFVLVALVPATAAGQTLADYDYENLELRGFGVDAGYIWPNMVEPTLSYGMRVDLGYLGPGVRIVPSLTYWSSALKRQELDRLAAQLNNLPALRDNGVVVQGSDLGEVDWTGLAFGLDGQYVWAMPLRLLTYLGLGLTAHALNARGEVIEGTFVEDALDSFSAGVTGLAGIEFEPVRRLRLFAEGRYTVLSDLRYAGVRFGASLVVPGTGDATAVGMAPARARGGAGR